MMNQFFECATPKVVALVLAGGAGSRVGELIPKQYIKVNGRMVITFCLRTLLLHQRIDAVQIVTEPDWRVEISSSISGKDALPIERKFLNFSLPGMNRQMSILSGLRDIRSYAGEDTLVLVHDAARPLLSSEQITACLDAAAGHDGAMPVLPMKDTVYVSRDGKRVTELLDRSQVFAGQAPEVFRLGKYLEANERLLPDRILEINGSTEPAVLAGLDMAIIPGDERNFKITTPGDLERFRQIAEKTDILSRADT